MPTTYAIPDGRVAMAATLYTGNGSTQAVSNAVNGVGFQPDLVWLKSRSGAANHTIFDSVRGVNNILYPNLTNANVFSANNLNSFNSNGYTLGANENSNDNAGESSVGWSWKGGGTAVSNTAGSITSSVSANTTAGFSVVTYTGGGVAGTIGHGLGVAPSMIIVKNRSDADGWVVYQASMGSPPQDYFMYLQSSAARYDYTSGNVWNRTAPTSTVFSVGATGATTTSGNNYVAYCFAPVSGYSAMGSYTGNGSTDGPFVYLGFRPRWVMVKCSSGVESWYVFDSSRDTYNVVGNLLVPNQSIAESTFASFDFLSNGLKVRTTNSLNNTNGATYIYAAFAEVPFKFANSR